MNEGGRLRWRQRFAPSLPVTGARAATVAVDVGHFLAKPGATSAYGGAGVRGQPFKLLRTPRGQRCAAVRLIGHRGELADLHARPRGVVRRAGFLLSVHHDSVKAHLLEPWVARP